MRTNIRIFSDKNVLFYKKTYFCTFTFSNRHHIMKLEIASLSGLAETARHFAGHMGDRTVFAFYGDMGAGKTTFIKALCAELGVTDTVNSPTFSIVNEYRSSTNGTPVYHFDFYRIRHIEEVYDMGYEEYFYSGAVCLIEWPELVEGLLPETAVRVRIEVLDDGRRTISTD